jgi:hypothetical protein
MVATNRKEETRVKRTETEVNERVWDGVELT